MEKAEFEEIGEYVLNSQNLFAQYIATRPIMDLCEEAVRMTGEGVANIWWDQKGLYIVEAIATAAAAAAGGDMDRKIQRVRRQWSGTKDMG